ncbi:MAG: HD domain-containing protein, partial [Chlorobiales bacterium]|nr:HD domain-containing protein [Chlorobiales bacterium]
MIKPGNLDFLFRSDGGFIRLPVWGHIPLIDPLKKVLAHPAFLRLKGIRQLSFAHHVFPGATHTRFEHSIGVYHLMKLILQRLVTNPLSSSLQTETFYFDDRSCRLLLATSLLHDIGHYPHAHVIEKIPISSTGASTFDGHEMLAERWIRESYSGFGSLAEIIENDWQLEAREVVNMISGKERMDFAKIINGTLDPDKMDYLMRDAHHCNIPYGSIDIERLIESFVPDPDRQRFAITDKGVAPLESLMFAKYMMMRNVYWHHTARTFSAMLRRLVQDILDDGILEPQKCRELFYANADERVLYDLKEALPKQGFSGTELIDQILVRQPYKRAISLKLFEEDFFGKDLSQVLPKLFEFSKNPGLRKQKEMALCRMLNRDFGLALKGHEIIIDAPVHKHIFDYEDFCELRIYRTPKANRKSEKHAGGQFISFDHSGDSAFRSDFILEFERYTKKFRVV